VINQAVEKNKFAGAQAPAAAEQAPVAEQAQAAETPAVVAEPVAAAEPAEPEVSGGEAEAPAAE
jgi:hypothetical protein